MIKKLIRYKQKKFGKRVKLLRQSVPFGPRNNKPNKMPKIYCPPPLVTPEQIVVEEFLEFETRTDYKKAKNPDVILIPTGF